LKAAREEKEKQEKSAEPPVAAAAMSTAPSGKTKCDFYESNSVYNLLLHQFYCFCEAKRHIRIKMTF
jgi:hypothetical protein